MEVIAIVAVALVVFVLIGFWVFFLFAASWSERSANDSGPTSSDSPVRTASASDRSK